MAGCGKAQSSSGREKQDRRGSATVMEHCMQGKGDGQHMSETAKGEE